MSDVDDALSISSGLSEWEVEFIESLGRRVYDDRLPLTAKQRAKLRQILESEDD